MFLTSEFRLGGILFFLSGGGFDGEVSPHSFLVSCDELVKSGDEDVSGILNRRPTCSSLPALQKYFSHVRLPEAVAAATVRDYKQEGWGTFVSARGSLGMLQKYQQNRIPFANLYLRYSRHHMGTLDQALVCEYLLNSGGIAREGESADGAVLERERSERERVRDGRGPSGGRGGTCTMNNGFFGTVMRSLGVQG